MSPDPLSVVIALSLFSVQRLVIDRAFLRLEVEVDPLERTRRERELVVVGIGDSRQRIASHVERRPGNEPSGGARDIADGDLAAVHR